MKYFYNKTNEYINSLNQKFREKAVIKQDLYNKIQQYLLLPKGTSNCLFSTNFTYWVKRKFVLNKIAAVDVATCIIIKNPFCIYENFYNVANEAHSNISHDSHETAMYEINCQYEVLSNTFEEPNTIPTVKHGGDSIIARGYFTRQGVGKLCVLDRVMDRFDYPGILEQSLQPSSNHFKLGQRCILMHDNDPQHTSGLIIDWKEKGFKSSLGHHIHQILIQ